MKKAKKTAPIMYERRGISLTPAVAVLYVLVVGIVITIIIFAYTYMTAPEKLPVPSAAKTDAPAESTATPPLTLVAEPETTQAETYYTEPPTMTKANLYD